MAPAKLRVAAAALPQDFGDRAGESESRRRSFPAGFGDGAGRGQCSTESPIVCLTSAPIKLRAPANLFRVDLAIAPAKLRVAATALPQDFEIAPDEDNVPLRVRLVCLTSGADKTQRAGKRARSGFGERAANDSAAVRPP